MAFLMDARWQQLVCDGVKPHLTGLTLAGLLSFAINILSRQPEEARVKVRVIAGNGGPVSPTGHLITPHAIPPPSSRLAADHRVEVAVAVPLARVFVV